MIHSYFLSQILRGFADQVVQLMGCSPFFQCGVVSHEGSRMVKVGSDGPMSSKTASS